MADITDSDSRTKAMGLIGTAFNAGFVLGPALGGTLSHYWGAAMPGFVATGLCTLNLLFAWIALPESLTPEKRAVMKEQIKQRSGMKEVLHVLRMPTVGILIILFFLITAAWGGLYSTFTLFCVDDFHLDVAYIGYMMGYLGLVSALVQANIGFFTKRFRESYVMVAGAVVMLLGLLLLGMANSVMMIVLGITVLSIGAGLNTPTLLAIMSKAAGEYEQGSTMGINQSMSSLARVFGPWGGILAYESLGHTSPYFAGGIIMAVVSARSVWFAVRPRSQSA
jgi:DHA1 family tetracycline resistance protein-like MFS transporter